MKRKDARMSVTTESINNAKMLKLYSWQDDFMKRAFRRRSAEVFQLKKRGVIIAGIVGSIYLFPSLLAPVTFTTYIGLGNTLDYNTAVAALILFQLMKDPMISIPMFFSDVVELVVSMRRIEKFINLYEVQKNIIERVEGNESENSIEIKGNFSWGFSSKENEGGKNSKKNEQENEEKEKKKKAKKGKITDETEEEKKEEEKSLKKFMTLKAIEL